MDGQAKKTAVAWLSVASNISLVVLKVIIGLLVGSVSIISEAIHSGVDLLASCIALVAVKKAGEPADSDHPFGHGKMENVAGTIEGLLIFLAAAWIIYEAIQKFRHPEPMEHLGLGIGVMLVSAVANILVSRRLFKVAKETDSVALQADAVHLSTDVYTSVGVMAGLALMWVGSRLFPGTSLHWIDPVAAILVALLIIHAAYELVAQAARDLLDARLPVEEEAWIRAHIERLRPTIRGYHRLRTRKAGSIRFIEFHLIVEAEMSVEEAHRISEVMVCDIEGHFPASSVTVHIEPCDGVCTPVCRSGCLLADDEQTAVQG